MSLKITSLLTLGLVAGLSLQLNATIPPTIESDNRLEVIGILCLIHAADIQDLDLQSRQVQDRTWYLRSLRQRAGTEHARVPLQELIAEAIAEAQVVFDDAGAVDIELIDMSLELMGMLFHEENGPPNPLLRQINQLRTEVAGLRTECADICDAMAQCITTLENIPVLSGSGGVGR